MPDKPEIPPIQAIEATAAERAYLASLQPEWPPGRLAGPLGLEIRLCVPPESRACDGCNCCSQHECHRSQGGCYDPDSCICPCTGN